MMRRKDDERGLTTLLFTDIVGSSEVASELGDRRWGRLQARHHAEVRKLLKRHGGQEIDTAGDGFFATFPSPAAGVRCAAEIAEAVRELGLEVRAGIHIGEIERGGEKGVAGIAVTVAARVAAIAGPGEVLVTDTIVQLTQGAGQTFAEVGSRELKGVPGRWDLYLLTAVDGHPVPPPRDAEEARHVRLRVAPDEAGRRTRRPTIVFGVGAGAVLLALIVLWASVTGPGAPAASPGPERRVIVALDDRTGGAAFEVNFPIIVNSEAGFGPFVFTGDPGSPVAFAWLPYGGVAQVNRMDGGVADQDAIDRFRGDVTCTCVAAAAGRLWAPVSTKPRPPGSGTNPPGVALSGFGLEGQRDRYVVVDPGLHGETVRAIAADGTHLWLTDISQDVVYRVDLSSEDVTVVHVPLTPYIATFADGSLWLLDPIGGKLVRVSRHGRVGHTYPIAGDPEALAVGGGFVWVADRTGRIWRIPESLGAQATEISLAGIGNQPNSIAYDGGPIVVGFGDGTVAKIDASDPSSPAVLWKTVVGNDASSIGVADGVVWVAGHPYAFGV